MSDDMMRLVEPLIPALRRYARALLRDAADDLVHDCLERVIGRWHQHRADGNARTWVFTILHNLAVNRLKRTARRSYCLEDFVEDGARAFRELSIEKAVLIGLSMGGIVAQKFALKYGHLLKALVLADTTLRGTGNPMIADRQWRWRCANSAWRRAIRSTCRTAGSPFPLLVAPTSSIRLGKSLR